jgi:acrylyl-CoA reductase (NADPH)
VVDRNTLNVEGPPISTERWAGSVDAVGGRSLENILAQTAYGGVMTTCGFVGGRDLPASVLPFILRGVTLSRIDSVRAPRAVRERAWERLATDLDLEKLGTTVSVVGLAEVEGVAREMLSGRIRGRTLVDVGR